MLSLRTTAFTVAAATLLVGQAARAQDEPSWAAAARGSGEIKVQRWFTPANAGTAAYDFGFSRPTVAVEIGGWKGNWGARVDATIFGETLANGQTTPYIAGGGFFGDVQGRYRLLDNRLALNLGLRVLTFRNVSYGTLGATYTQPLTPWLDLDVDALAGTNVNLAYVLDGSLGLSAHYERFGVGLGFRALDLQCGCIPPEPALGLAAPYLSLSVAI